MLFRSSAGALVFAASFALFAVNLIWSARRGALAGANPWDAGTLEWAASSPPASYNFVATPVVSHGEPLWRNRDSCPAALGLTKREVLVTSAIDAVPQMREDSPPPDLWPLVSAIALTIAFIGSIFTPWAVVWGGALVGIALIGWFWPKSVEIGRAHV